MSKNVWSYVMLCLIAVTCLSFIYVIANNITYKHLWMEKCKDGGGITVTTPEGYICINPNAIVEVY